MKKALLWIAVLVVAFASVAASQETGGFARKEVVVISGQPLAPLVGTPPANLSLFAMTAKGFEPVPFQIDQRYQKGKSIEYVYTGGPLSRSSRNRDLVELDELVFWSGDAGPKVPNDKWPEKVRGTEIEIADPVTGAKGYVYLLAFSAVAPRTDRRYVKYDPKKDTVDTPYYHLGYNKKYKLGFTNFFIKPEAGGTGQNFVDEMKYWIMVRLGGKIIPYDIDKKQVHSKVQGYIDGPVRARRKLRNYIELFVYLGSTSHSESVYTPSGFSIEVPVIGVIPVPWLTNLSTRWDMELNKDAMGMTFRSDKNPQGVEITGTMSDAERKLDYSPPAWVLISGKPGAVLRRPGKESSRTLYMDLYYNDNVNYTEANEEEPGQIGAVGYFVPYAGRRGLKIRENIVDYFDVLPNYNQGDEAAFLANKNKPLQVIVSSLTISNKTAAPQTWPEPTRARKDKPEPSYTYAGAEAPEIQSQVLPVLVMSSDNGFGAGAMYVNANPFNTHIRFMGQMWYTMKSYNLTEFIIGEEKPREGSGWFWWSHGKYHLRPGRDFYGIGNNSRHADRTNFYDEVFSWEWRVGRKIYGPFWIGAMAEMRHEYTGPGKGDWAPDTFEPGHFPNLFGKGSMWTNRVGAFLLMDTRNNYYYPSSGGYRMIQYYSVPKWLGNDFNFEYWYLDVRQFIPIREPRKDVLALRFQARHAEGGPIPFYELAVNGSEYTLRGFFDGRFRDRDMACVNVEWRHNLWKIVDLHVFYDVGKVYDNIFENTKFIANDYRTAYGTGFRIIIPPNIVMRGDIGWSNTDQVFYFNFGQTF